MQREYSEYVQQQIQNQSTFEANRIDRSCAEFLALKVFGRLVFVYRLDPRRV